jgi:hypothetical protein
LYFCIFISKMDIFSKTRIKKFHFYLMIFSNKVQ